MSLWIKKRIYNLLLWLYQLLYLLKFWAKTFLYRWAPGGYGYYRHLRSYRDPNYVHERDKHPIREKHYCNEGWGSQGQQLKYRDYSDYDEYVTHQVQKLDEKLKLHGGFSNQDIAEYRLKFYLRFKRLHHLLPKSALIVCAGARQGTEVEVLHDLGFKNAYGIDLNPGPSNPYVRQGDFMQLDNESSSVDLLYTNCVDHAFNLDQFFAEHARVIKQDGYVLYDLARLSKSSAGIFEAVEWKTEEDILLLMLRYFREIIWVETESSWKWILLRGKRDT